MPIKYDVYNNGKLIYAVASGSVTDEEYIEFEIKHAIDDRIKPPVSELLKINSGAFKNITTYAISEVLNRRKKSKRNHIPHSCAIVVSYSDSHAWDLAKYYEGMVKLHYPASVIVFGDEKIALTWLGIDPGRFETLIITK